MRKFLPILLAAACIPQIASATALTFFAGTTPVFSFTTATGTGFVDTYTFTTSTAAVFSGSLTTQRLRVPAITGPIVSELDFVSASLDTVHTFTDLTTFDAFQQLRLASTNIGSGAHTLLVTYNAIAASNVNAASYAGALNLGAATVPEAATWAMFIGGFGLIGAQLRRRRTTYNFA